MPDRFSLIVDKYREFTDSLLNKGVLPLRETSNGFWGISVCEEVFFFFLIICFQCYRSFIDVGSGDGRVTAIASLFTNAVGIESDKELYEMSVKIKEELGLNCEFVNKDSHEYDESRLEVL
jgi:predicted RNA methylase